MMDNPFMVGCEVVGDQFIGRREWLDRLERGMLRDNQRFGSLAINGLPRIGKSSLVRNALLGRKSLRRKDIIRVILSVGDFESFPALMSEMIRRVYDEIEDANGLTMAMERVAEPFLKFTEMSWQQMAYSIERFFSLLRRNGRKLVLVLDEFDFAVRTFGDGVHHFQFLRGLASRAEFNISVILISRKELRLIEQVAHGGSTLHGVFETVSLHGFSDADLDEGFKRFDDIGISLTEQQKSDLLFHAGRSPLLFAALGHEIAATGSAVDMSEIYERCSQQFLNYYASLLSLMKQEDLYEKMLQVFIGPRYDLTTYDVTSLMSRGYVHQDANGRFQTVSAHFVEYIRTIGRVEFGQTLNTVLDTERKMRLVVERELVDLFGTEWPAELQRRNQSLDAQKRWIIDYKKVETTRQSNRKLYNDRASANLLHVISLRELVNIIREYWNERFSTLFPNAAPPAWFDRFNKLVRARNPLAHGTPEYLSDLEIQEVDLVCRQIQETLGITE